MTSRATEITFTPAEPIATSSASSSSARACTNAGGRLRETAIRGRSAVARRDDGRVAGVERLPQHRLGDRPGGQVAGLPERDVHGPVVARHLGELPGAVERVDDPDPLGLQAALVVLALLGEHGVGGPVLGQQRHQQLVGGPVAGVLELASLQTLGAHLEQPATGRLGQPGGHHVVVGGRVVGRGAGVEGHRLTLAERSGVELLLGPLEALGEQASRRRRRRARPGGGPPCARRRCSRTAGSRRPPADPAAGRCRCAPGGSRRCRARSAATFRPLWPLSPPPSLTRIVPNGMSSSSWTATIRSAGTL